MESALHLQRVGFAYQVTNHLHSLLKDSRWDDFCAALSNHHAVKDGSAATMVLQIPVVIRQADLDVDRSDSVPRLLSGFEITRVDRVEGEVTAYVSLKIQKTEKGSAEDDELGTEASFLRRSTQTVKSGTCVHFPLLMAHIVFDEIGSSGGSRELDSDSSRWYAFVNEWADGDFCTLLKPHPSLEVTPTHACGVIQTLMGMNVMHRLWKVHHNDFHPGNVLYIHLDGHPLDFIYDIPCHDGSIFRVVLHKSPILTLLWDFSKTGKVAELASNDFFEFFSQVADVHPRLTTEVKTITGFTPVESMDVFEWTRTLIKRWAEDPRFSSFISYEEGRCEDLSPLPLGAIYSSMGGKCYC